MKKADEAIPNNKLKQERVERNWTQGQVAEKIGASRVNVSRWEHGRVLPDMYFRQQLCELFGKNAYELGLIRFNADQTSADAHPRLYDSAIPPVSPASNCLVGRDMMLGTLKRRLCASQDVALSALDGLPGVGKTALAIALAHDAEVQEHFCDGMLWAGLGPTPNVPGHLSRWGMALGLASATMAQLMSMESWASALHAAIGMRRLLLVIDDVWQVEDALTFKVGGPACTYLITTRFPDIAFQWAEEGTTTVHELSEEDGLSLLARLAPQAFEAEPEALQSLVRSVGGLPLALTLLGKYAQQLALKGQPRRLRAALERLSSAEERLQLTQQQAPLERPPNLPAGMSLSLHTAIAVSDQCLDDQEQEVLRALSVLPAKPATFSEAAALAVTDAPAHALDRLSDAGLLESGGPGRYTLHQTIADYARVHLSGRGAYERLMAYAACTVEKHHTDYETLDAESSTIYAALEEAYTLGYSMELVRIICAFTPFLHLRGLYTSAELHLRRALEITAAMGDLYQITKVWRYLGNNAYKRGNYAQAESHYQKGLTLARQFKDDAQISPLIACLGTLAHEGGDYAQAEAYYQEGLTLARQLGHSEQMSVLLMNLGVIAHERGTYAQAESYYQEGLALACQIGHRDRISNLLMNLGELAGEQGDYDQAQIYLQEGLALARQIGHQERASSLLRNLGRLASEQGNYDQAQTYLEEAQELVRQISKPRLICALLGESGELSLKQRRWDAAAAAFDEILARMQEGSPDLLALAQYGLARAAAAQGYSQEAWRLAEASLAIFDTLGHRRANEVRNFLEAVAQSSVEMAKREEPDKSISLSKPCCPLCRRDDTVVKSGMNRTGSRRYRCQSCRRYFTPEPELQGYDAVVKAQALALYDAGTSVRGIARMLGLHHQTINNWIKAQAESEVQ